MLHPSYLLVSQLNVFAAIAPTTTHRYTSIRANCLVILGTQSNGIKYFI
jgi:hypothetical protein